MYHINLYANTDPFDQTSPPIFHSQLSFAYEEGIRDHVEHMKGKVQHLFKTDRASKAMVVLSKIDWEGVSVISADSYAAPEKKRIVINEKAAKKRMMKSQPEINAIFDEFFAGQNP